MRVFKSIVLVDDDRDDHEIFKAACALLDRTLEVLGFENGEEALQTLSIMQKPPDMIFLDLNMPRRNGIEVLEELKQSKQLQKIPVVIYSTSFDLRVKDKCESLGAAEIMEKPGCFDVLCEKLQAVLHSLS
jgi:CheY-like chemotaxis protein